MIKISVKSENEQAVADSLGTTEGRVRFAIATGLARGLLIATGIAQRSFLSGPRPEKLDVRSGRLRLSISSEVDVNENVITGLFGTNVPYGPFWEWGFFGTEQVRAHTRVCGWTGIARDKWTGRKMAADLPTRRHRGKEGALGWEQDIRPAHVRAGLSNFSSMEQVRAHTRDVHQPGRPYLRPALEQTDIMAEVNKELVKVKDA